MKLPLVLLRLAYRFIHIVFVLDIKPEHFLVPYLRSLCIPLRLLCLAAPKAQKPKLLKPQPRKVMLVSISAVLLIYMYLIYYHSFNKLR